ncbi:MAG: HAD-IB family phosphatase [Clostridia bacterium]|nr:HAD-IB family phosphatase [Clostridia bacterium]
MNVYDFDNTILRGDSTALFFFWSLRHRPRMWLDLPAQALNGLLFVLKKREKQVFKQRMLAFLRFHPDPAKAVEAFWKENASRIKPWYRRQHREDDIVISASPEFLIRPMCRSLGIRTVLGSPVDPRTGHFSGLNCHGEEKVRRLHEVRPDAAIDAFYSDSLSDAPLARLAGRAYLVKGDDLTEWP